MVFMKPKLKSKNGPQIWTRHKILLINPQSGFRTNKPFGGKVLGLYLKNANYYKSKKKCMQIYLFVLLLAYCSVFMQSVMIHQFAYAKCYIFRVIICIMQNITVYVILSTSHSGGESQSNWEPTPSRSWE